MIIVRPHNESFIQVHSTPDILKEISEQFSFYTENYKFSPKFKARKWDGKVRCYNQHTKLLYRGLFTKLQQFAEYNHYPLEITEPEQFVDDQLSIEQYKQFIEDINLIDVKPRDYQIKAFVRSVRKKRQINVISTGGGKSLLAYLLTRYYNKRTVIVVPTVNLVDQMYHDFIEYGYDSDKYCQRVYSGQERYNITKPVVITTWQSAYMMEPEWLEQFEVIIGDEAHLFGAKSLVGLMSGLNNCAIRIGLTGTIDNSKTNKMMLEGLFGPIYQPVTTKQLIDQKVLSKPLVKGIILLHPKVNKFLEYNDEQQYLFENTKRNQFITNLALSLPNNYIILFSHREHGRLLYNALSKGKSNVFYVDGTIKPEDEQQIRQFALNNENYGIVASFKKYALGVNIPNIRNIILGSSTKSTIRLLQSIGRGLRITRTKDTVIIFDIADNLQNNNITLRHFNERIEIYNKVEFDYKLYNVKL